MLVLSYVFLSLQTVYYYQMSLISIARFLSVIGEVQSTEAKCLVLQVINKTSLKFVSCKGKHYGICSRVADASNVVNRPAFVNLISNMTIERHKTSKMKRKQNSAGDTRTSVKALGSVLSVGVITVVGSLLILSDVHTLSREKRKTKQTYTFANSTCIDK